MSIYIPSQTGTVTMQYLDDNYYTKKVADSQLASKLSTSGGNLTGELNSSTTIYTTGIVGAGTCVNAPTVNLQAADNQLVFTHGSAYPTVISCPTGAGSTPRIYQLPEIGKDGKLVLSDTSGNIDVSGNINVSGELSVNTLNYTTLNPPISGGAPNRNSGAVLYKAGQLIKRDNNFGGAQAAAVESPYVFFDGSGPNATNLWYMCYTAYSGTPGAEVNGSIMLAKSVDMYNWTQLGVILSHGSAGTYDAGGCTASTITYNPVDQKYYLHYSALGTAGYEAGTVKLAVATSTTVTGTYTKYAGNPILSPPGGTSLWYATKIFHRCWIAPEVTGGTWYMFFNAEGYSNGSGSNVLEERTGYATTTDLLTFTVNATPSLADEVSPPSYGNTNRVGDPSIYKFGDYYIMAYYTVSTSPFKAYDCLAYTKVSDFPTGWTRWAAVNPVLSPTPSPYDTTNYDYTFAHKPMCVVRDGTVYHYYTAVGGTERSIALAIQSPPNIDGPRGRASIGLATSATQSLSASNSVNVIWNTTCWNNTPNNGSDFVWPYASDSAKVQVVKDGMYLITGSMNMTVPATVASTDLWTLAIMVNGSRVWGQALGLPVVASTTARLNVSQCVHLNAGDVINMVVYQNNGANTARTIGRVSAFNIKEEQPLLSITRL